MTETKIHRDDLPPSPGPGSALTKRKIVSRAALGERGGKRKARRRREQYFRIKALEHTFKAETKGAGDKIDNVATPAGVRKYNAPIGTPIRDTPRGRREAAVRAARIAGTARPAAKPAGSDDLLMRDRKKYPHLKFVAPDYEGYTTVVGRNGAKFHITKTSKGWQVEDDNDEVIFSEVPKEARAYKILDNRNQPHPGVDGPMLPGWHKATPAEIKKLKVPPGYEDIIVPNKGTDEATKINWRGYSVKKLMAKSDYITKVSEDNKAEKFDRVMRLFKVISKLDHALYKDVNSKDPAIREAARATLLMRKLGFRPSKRGTTGSAGGESFGAMTFQARHISQYPDTGRTTFTFPGKGGKKLTISTRDPDVYKVIKSQMQGKAAGDYLFDTNATKAVAYMRSRVGADKEGGGEFLLYDLRALRATTLALNRLQGGGGVSAIRRPKTKTEYKKARNQIGDEVAAQLGNTRTVALASYIVPSVFMDTWNMPSEWMNK